MNDKLYFVMVEISLDDFLPIYLIVYPEHEALRPKLPAHDVWTAQSQQDHVVSHCWGQGRARQAHRGQHNIKGGILLQTLQDVSFVVKLYLKVCLKSLYVVLAVPF